MAFINISLNDAFEKTFGYKTEAFKFEDVKNTSKDRLLQSSTGAKYWSTDATGREYYMPIFLDSQELPYPILSFTIKKTIIETALTERRGTVNELISIDNYEFTIKGLIVSQDNTYPEEKIRMLRTLFEKNEALEIRNPITDTLLIQPDRSGSDLVVIQDWSMPETRGIRNVRGYELKLKSEEPFSLEEV